VKNKNKKIFFWNKKQNQKQKMTSFHEQLRFAMRSNDDTYTPHSSPPPPYEEEIVSFMCSRELLAINDIKRESTPFEQQPKRDLSHILKPSQLTPSDLDYLFDNTKRFNNFVKQRFTLAEINKLKTERRRLKNAEAARHRRAKMADEHEKVVAENKLLRKVIKQLDPNFDFETLE